MALWLLVETSSFCSLDFRSVSDVGHLRMHGSPTDCSTLRSSLIGLMCTTQGWGSISTNPSEVIGKRLDGAILDLADRRSVLESSQVHAASQLSEDTTESAGSATVTFQSLRVSYRDVEQLIPAMHESGEWDCIVHLGVAASYKTCTIETGSSEFMDAGISCSSVRVAADLLCLHVTDTTGYNLQDVDGALAPELKGGRGVRCEEPRWECTLDCRKCCEELNGLGFQVRSSTHFQEPPGY